MHELSLIRSKKKENEASHNSREIERNSMGQAVIPLTDFTKNVIAYAVVDDDEWHRLAKHSWCSVNKRYAVSKINNEKYLYASGLTSWSRCNRPY